MNATHRIRMLRWLTALYFMFFVLHWQIHWGFDQGHTTSAVWLWSSLYGAGNVALLWGVLLALAKSRGD